MDSVEMATEALHLFFFRVCCCCMQNNRIPNRGPNAFSTEIRVHYFSIGSNNDWKVAQFIQIVNIGQELK